MRWYMCFFFFFFSSRRRHTRSKRDWSSDVCSSDLANRIPFARGLGSSSATIALGLVAATRWKGREPDPEQLLALALRLEAHADNLAACLLGGATLAWEEGDGWRAQRVTESLALEPLAVVPHQRVETPAARAALPKKLP